MPILQARTPDLSFSLISFGSAGLSRRIPKTTLTRRFSVYAKELKRIKRDSGQANISRHRSAIVQVNAVNAGAPSVSIPAPTDRPP